MGGCSAKSADPRPHRHLEHPHCKRLCELGTMVSDNRFMVNRAAAGLMVSWSRRGEDAVPIGARFGCRFACHVIAPLFARCSPLAA
eukprot:6045258-Prorocentrum_lima.AAC.1